MLKLMKYELRKARTIYLILLAGIIALQVYFLISLQANSDSRIIVSVSFLFIGAYIAAIVLLIMGIVSYSKELKQKTSYLIFLTPNSTLRVMLAKMLHTLLSGIVFGALLFALALWDVRLLIVHYGEYISLYELVEELLIRYSINLQQIYMLIGYSLAAVLLTAISALVVAYLAITLSATLLQQSRLRDFVSVVFYFAILYGLNRLSQLYFDADVVLTNAMDILHILTPLIIQNAVVIVVSLLGSAWLLEKKVSL